MGILKHRYSDNPIPILVSQSTVDQVWKPQASLYTTGLWTLWSTVYAQARCQISGPTRIRTSYLQVTSPSRYEWTIGAAPAGFLRCTSHRRCRPTHPIPVQCWASVAAHCCFGTRIIEKYVLFLSVIHKKFTLSDLAVSRIIWFMLLW